VRPICLAGIFQQASTGYAPSVWVVVGAHQQSNLLPRNRMPKFIRRWRHYINIEVLILENGRNHLEAPGNLAGIGNVPHGAEIP
jgi:hypothetical protein